MAAEIVHYHDIAGCDGRDENALDVDAEDVAIHRTVEDPGRINPIVAQRRDEGRGVPVRERCRSWQPLALRAQPRRGAIFVFTQVSSMNTNRFGSILP